MGSKPSPVTSTPSAFSSSSALVIQSFDQADAGGSSVIGDAPVSFTAESAPFTVASHAASSITPMPSGDGQMSLLVSLTIHSSWLGPQLEPAAMVMSEASCG